LKSQSRSRKTFFFFIFLGFLLVVLLLSHKTIFTEAGKFLSPEGTGNADVVILECPESIGGQGVEMGISLLSSKRANRLVIVYHNSEKERIFDRPMNYNDLLIQKLENLGLQKDQVQVIGVAIDHPITLTEAQIVLSHLSKDGVKTAILLAEGFHTRRSYWTYKHVGLPLGIKIIPYPYFTLYQNKNWWQEIGGVEAFVYESLKFLYYLLRGYIPAKSLLVT
jgi:hypothetical protein